MALVLALVKLEITGRVAGVAAARAAAAWTGDLGRGEEAGEGDLALSLLFFLLLFLGGIFVIFDSVGDLRLMMVS